MLSAPKSGQLAARKAELTQRLNTLDNLPDEQKAQAQVAIDKGREVEQKAAALRDANVSSDPDVQAAVTDDAADSVMGEIGEVLLALAAF